MKLKKEKKKTQKVSPPLRCGALEQLQRLQDIGLVRLDHLPAGGTDHLVEHVVGRFQIKHDVELADVAEVAVERLDQGVDQLECREAVFSCFVTSVSVAAAIFAPAAAADSLACALPAKKRGVTLGSGPE